MRAHHLRLATIIAVGCAPSAHGLVLPGHHRHQLAPRPPLPLAAAAATTLLPPQPPQPQPKPKPPHRCAPSSIKCTIAWDLPLGVASWALIFGYNAWAKKFTAKWASQNAEARAVWARYILEKGDYILGVQTLRNALTSASFFASACFTTLSLVVGLASQRAASLSGLALLKYATACTLLVGGALSYLQSVRYMNTIAFLFQVANDQRDETCSRGTVMLLMVLSQNCWAAGERMLYLLLPAFTWIFGGGAAMLGVTFAFLPMLYFKDLPAPTNLLADDEPTLKPYGYLLGRFEWLDVFGFKGALETAQATVAKSGNYAKEKYGLEDAVWPPRRAEAD